MCDEPTLLKFGFQLLNRKGRLKSLTPREKNRHPRQFFCGRLKKWRDADGGTWIQLEDYAAQEG